MKSHPSLRKYFIDDGRGRVNFLDDVTLVSQPHVPRDPLPGLFGPPQTGLHRKRRVIKRIRNVKVGWGGREGWKGW